MRFFSNALIVGGQPHGSRPKGGLSSGWRRRRSNSSCPKISAPLPSFIPFGLFRSLNVLTSPSSSSSYHPVLSPGFQTPPRATQQPTSTSHPTTAASSSSQRLSQLGSPLSPSHYDTTPPSRPTPSSATGSPESRDPDNVRFALPTAPRPPLGRLMNAPRQMSAPPTTYTPYPYLTTTRTLPMRETPPPPPGYAHGGQNPMTPPREGQPPVAEEEEDDWYGVEENT